MSRCLCICCTQQLQWLIGKHLRRFTAVKDDSICDLASSADLQSLAVFTERTEAWGKDNVFLFKLGAREPSQTLLLTPAPALGEAREHKWSPDSKQLVTSWRHLDRLLVVAHLTHDSTSERWASSPLLGNGCNAELSTSSSTLCCQVETRLNTCVCSCLASHHQVLWSALSVAQQSCTVACSCSSSHCLYGKPDALLPPACLCPLTVNVLQFFGQPCCTPICWAPDSSLVSMSIKGRLEVLNSSLESVYVWAAPVYWEVVSAWTPGGYLMVAMCQPGVSPRQSHLLTICGHQSQPESTCAAASLATLLAQFGPQEALKELAYSPANGVAAVTGTACEHGSCQCQYTLHVLVPGFGLNSVAVGFSCLPYAAALVWSPAGDRLLVICPQRLQLVTLACVLVLDMPWEGSHAEKCTSPIFSPDGHHVAAVCATGSQQDRQLRLRLFAAANGAVVFEHVWGGELWYDTLAFGPSGDQLVLMGEQHAYAFTLGQACEANTLSSGHMCDAIARACFRVEAPMEEEDMEEEEKEKEEEEEEEVESDNGDVSDTESEYEKYLKYEKYSEDEIAESEEQWELMRQESQDMWG